MKKAVSFLLVSLLVIAASFACTHVARLDRGTIEQARQDGIPVIFTWINQGPPNSAGGVNAYIYFVNATQKIIKYVRIHVIPYNSVGDPVRSSIGNKSRTTLKSTGPFEPGRGNGGLTSGKHWTNVWYNYTIVCIEVVGADIEFMDGTETSINRMEMGKALQRGVRNSCSIETNAS